MVRPMVRGVIGSPFGGSSFHDGISYSAETGRVVLKAVGAAPTITTLTSAFTFTGGNQSMYMGPAGLLVASATNTPRIEYDASGNCLGLLMEAARTNLALQSQTFDNASWTKSASAVTANQLAAPDGTTTAEKFDETAGTAVHFMQNALAYVISAGATYTATIFAKAGERNFLQIGFDDGTADGGHATFDLSLGTVTQSANKGTGSGIVASIVSAGSGWYRLRVTTVVSAGALTGRMFVVLSTSGTPGFAPSYAGTASNGCYIWGAQVEAGAFPSSYIPTTTTSVARTADSCIRTLGSEFSATAGTVVVAGRASGGQEAALGQSVWEFNNNTAAERWRQFRAQGTDTNRTQVTVASAALGNMDAGSFTNSATFKSAAAYANNDYATSFNGAAVQTLAVAVPTLSHLNLGMSINAIPMNGHIRRFDYYPTRQPNPFLVSASA
jgi:hypothetical protein